MADVSLCRISQWVAGVVLELAEAQTAPLLFKEKKQQEGGDPSIC